MTTPPDPYALGPIEPPPGAYLTVERAPHAPRITFRDPRDGRVLVDVTIDGGRLCATYDEADLDEGARMFFAALAGLAGDSPTAGPAGAVHPPGRVCWDIDSNVPATGDAACPACRVPGPLGFPTPPPADAYHDVADPVAYVALRLFDSLGAFAPGYDRVAIALREAIAATDEDMWRAAWRDVAGRRSPGEDASR